MAKADKPTCFSLPWQTPVCVGHTPILANTSDPTCPSSESMGSDSSRLRSHASSPSGSTESPSYQDICKLTQAAHGNTKGFLFLLWEANDIQMKKKNQIAGPRECAKVSETLSHELMYLWQSRPCAPTGLAACRWICSGPCACPRPSAAAVSPFSWPPGPSGPAAAGWCISHAARRTMRAREPRV